MKKYILTISLLVFALLSCENDLPFDLGYDPPKLVINSLINANTDENDLYFGLTGREEATLSMEGGTVNVYVNGELKQTIIPKYSSPPELKPSEEYWNDYWNQWYEWARTKPYRVLTDVKFSPGDKVRIEATTQDKRHHAWGEEIVPKPLEITRMDTMMYTSKIGNSSWENEKRYIRLKITFTDTPNEKNYYRLVAQRENLYSGKSVFTLNDTIIKRIYTEEIIIKEDVVLTDGRPVIDDDDNIVSPPKNRCGVFDDSRLNGEYTMTVSVPYVLPYGNAYPLNKIENVSATLRVRLLSISETQYYYLRALNIYDSSDYDEALNNPIRFPSNIKNGAGILGISSESSKSIYLYDYNPDDYLDL